jgi:hypothetical protein
MTIRTSNKAVKFARPFLLKGVDRVLPAGEYRVATDEELIQELSFPVYRRVATMIFVPAESHRASARSIQLPQAWSRENATPAIAMLSELLEPGRSAGVKPKLIA